MKRQAKPLELPRCESKPDDSVDLHRPVFCRRSLVLAMVWECIGKTRRGCAPLGRRVDSVGSWYCLAYGVGLEGAMAG